MNRKGMSLSVNGICWAAAGLLAVLSAGFLALLYLCTFSAPVLLLGAVYAGITAACLAAFVALIRRKLVLFSDSLCGLLDAMMSGQALAEHPQAGEQDTLFYKIRCRLVRLYEIMGETRNVAVRERADLQELISDISHQVKTPITNLKMINSTLLEQPVPEESRRKFLLDSNSQLDKLTFLMEAMIKTSRLETGVISLEKRVQPLYNTLAAALGGILLSAEKKDIRVTADCPEKLELSHDGKWTAEALFNILDNAVKYTSAGGSVRVAVEQWECYAKIDISDTGRGIPERDQGAVFKRFFRGQEVHDVEGIGIGLYLAREIITMQGGYIKVSSQAGRGSVFSVFLPLK